MPSAGVLAFALGAALLVLIASPSLQVAAQASSQALTASCVLFNGSSIDASDPWQLDRTVAWECQSTRGGIRNCCGAVRYAVRRARALYLRAVGPLYIDLANAGICFNEFVSWVRAAINDTEPLSSFTSPTIVIMDVCLVAPQNFTVPASTQDACGAFTTLNGLANLTALVPLTSSCMMPGSPTSSACQSCRTSVEQKSTALTVDLLKYAPYSQCEILVELAIIALSPMDEADAVAQCLTLRNAPVACSVNYSTVDYAPVLQSCGSPEADACCPVLSATQWASESFYALKTGSLVVPYPAQAESCGNAFAARLEGIGVNSSALGRCGLSFPGYSFSNASACAGLSTVAGFAMATSNFSAITSVCQGDLCDSACTGDLASMSRALLPVNATTAEIDKCSQQALASWVAWLDGQNYTKACLDMTCATSLPAGVTITPNVSALAAYLDTAPSSAAGPTSSGNGSTVLLEILVPIAGLLAVLCFTVGCLLMVQWRRRRRLRLKHPAAPQDDKPTSLFDPLKGCIQGLHLFELKELREATSNFAKANELGNGSCGSVYLANLPSHGKVAVKRLNDSHIRELITEMETVATLNHTNLVRLIGCCDAPNEKLLVYELMEGDSLSSHLYGSNKEPQLTWPQRVSIALDAARGLEYLHTASGSNAIVHRDVKSSNILLDRRLRAKLGDLGLARILPTSGATHVSTNKIMGTPGYIDPVMCVEMKVAPSSDVYSFGVVLLELLNNRPAIDSKKPNTSLVLWARDEVHSGRLPVDPTLDTPEHHDAIVAMVALAFRCIKWSTTERPNIRGAVKTLEQMEPLPERSSKGPSKGTVDEEMRKLLQLAEWMQHRAL